MEDRNQRREVTPKINSSQTYIPNKGILKVLVKPLLLIKFIKKTINIHQLRLSLPLIHMGELGRTESSENKINTLNFTDLSLDTTTYI